MSSKGALTKLLRIQGHELEVRKIVVGRLQTRLNALQEEDAQWETSLHHEKQLLRDDPQADVAFLRYASLVEKKRSQIERMSGEIERQLVLEQEKLKQEFAQVHSLEKYLSQERAKEDKSLEKKAQEALDDRFSHKALRG